MRFLLVASIPVSIDIVSCILQLRRTRRGSGPSGLPLVTIVLYVVVILGAQILSLPMKLLALIIAVGLHLALVFGLPTLDRALRAKSNTP